MTGSARRPPVVRIDDIVRVREADRVNGTGTLVMRVTGIGADLVRYPTLEWLRLLGVEIHRDGTEGDRHDVMVRVDAQRRPGAVIHTTATAVSVRATR